MKKLFALLAVMLFAVVSFGQEISTDTLLPARTIVVAPVYIATWEVYYPGDSLPKFNDLFTSRDLWRRAGGGSIVWDSTTAIRIKQRGIDTANFGKGFRIKHTIELLPR